MTTRDELVEVIAERYARGDRAERTQGYQVAIFYVSTSNCAAKLGGQHTLPSEGR
jgi:hypothetical protein